MITVLISSRFQKTQFTKKKNGLPLKKYFQFEPPLAVVCSSIDKLITVKALGFSKKQLIDDERNSK